MLCAGRVGSEDVVRTGEVRAVIGLGIGITIGLRGVVGGAKFGSGWILRTLELGLKLGFRVGSAAGLAGREG